MTEKVDIPTHLVEMTEAEHNVYKKLLKALKHAHPEKFEGAYFICGEGGDKDSMLLPERIHICPALGSDIQITYEKKS